MRDLTQGNIYKTFFRFALPIMLSGLLSQSYNVIDTAIIGHWLSDDGLASAGATSTYITLLSSVLWGFSAAGGVFFGMLFGEKSFKRLKNAVISTSLILTLLALLLTPLSIVFKDVIFDFLKIDPSVRAEAFQYFGTYICGLLFVIMSNFGVHIFNALGMSSYPLKMSALSAILNVFGNLLSVTVLELGVFGVALSTILSALAVDVCYFIRLLKIWREMGVDKEKYTFCKNDVKTIISFSLPASGQQLIMYGASFFVSPFINALGKSATASYTVINRVFTVATSLYQNSSKTVTSFSSQCVGAKKYHLLRRGVKVGFVQAFAVLLPLLFICSVFAESVCSLFFEKGFDGEARSIAVNFVRWWMPLVVINAVNNLFHSFWRGIAKMSYLVAGTFVGGVSQIIATVLLAPRLGLDGIWTAWVLSWTIEAVFNLMLYFINKWEKPFRTQ